VPLNSGDPTSKPERPSGVLRKFVANNLFMVYALGCSICFAFHNYIVAISMMKWKTSMAVLFPEFIPLMLAAVIYHLHRAKTVVYPATGKLWT